MNNKKDVIKRDGRKENFDPQKIENAVLKAFGCVDGTITQEALEIAHNIANDIKNKHSDTMGVEDIQDAVETALMQTTRKDVAKAYIIYREDRNRIRQQKSDLMQRIGEKLKASNVQNQNANVDEKSFGGRKGEADSELLRDYALNYCMSEMAKMNHLNNEIYIHDLDHYILGDHNCLSIPFDKLLAKGFNTRQTDVRPARSVSTAFQLVAVIFQIQSLQQFGGVSATHIDHTMIPYVRMSFWKHYKDGIKYISKSAIPNNSFFDKLVFGECDEVSIDSEEYKKAFPDAYKYAMDMTEREIYQAVEGLYHNLNKIGRLGSNVRNIAI